MVNFKFLHKISFLLVLISSSFSLQLFSQNTETLTISTYYPSPTGVYQNLRLFPIAAAAAPLCDNAHPDNEGFMYYNNDAGQNQLMVCRETAAGVFSWQAVGASFWTLDGVSLYPNDTDFNVGIGTTAPDAKLDVNGFIAANGASDITANPPAVDGNVGWKLGLWGNGYATGIAGWTYAIKTGQWVSIFNGNPANNASDVVPDGNARVSLGVSGNGGIIVIKPRAGNPANPQPGQIWVVE